MDLNVIVLMVFRELTARLTSMTVLLHHVETVEFVRIPLLSIPANVHQDLLAHLAKRTSTIASRIPVTAELASMARILSPAAVFLDLRETYVRLKLMSVRAILVSLVEGAKTV